MQMKTREEKDRRIINYIKTKVKLRKNIGNNLISLFNRKELIEKIHHSAQEELLKILNNNISFNLLDIELVFISLVIIGLEFYDGNFYEHVEDVYAQLYKQYNKQKIDGVIRSVIREFMPQSEDYSRIITFALENAIAPMYYLSDFFDFMYDIYKINFQYSIENKNIDEELEFIYDGLKESFFTDDDDISVNVTNKTYKLIKSTKNLIIKKDSIRALIKFSKKTLKIIEDYYWNNKVELDNEYFNYGLGKWREVFEREKSSERSEYQRKNTYSRWKPDFEIHGKNIFLVIPPHNIKNEYDYTKIGVCIFENGKFVKEIEDFKVNTVFGGYKITVDNILIEKPFSNIQYKIFIDDQILYDSRDLLYRNYLIFNESGKEVVPDSKYKGNLFIAYKPGAIVDSEIVEYYETVNYCLGNTFYDGQRVLVIDNKVINSLNKSNYQIIGKKYEDVFIENNVKSCEVFQYVNHFLFSTYLNDYEIGINVNGNRKKLLNENYIKKDVGGNRIYICDYHLDYPGYYEISFFEIATEKVIKNAEFHFFIDTNLQYKLEKLNVHTYNLLLESSLNVVKKEFLIDINKYDEFSIDVCENEKIWNYELPLDIPIFKIDNMCWKSFEDYMWIDDVTFSSNMQFKYVKCDEINVFHEGRFLSKIIPKENGRFVNADIATLNNYKQSYDFVDLDIYYKGNKKNQIRCYNKTVVSEGYPQIYYDPERKNLQFNICFFGNKKLKLTISTLDKKIQESRIIENNEAMIEFSNILSDTELEISIVEVQNGFSLLAPQVLYNKIEKFWAYSDLENRYVRIESVNFEMYTKYSFEFKTFHLKRTFIEFKKYLGNKKFIGELYIMENGSKIIFDKISPLEIEFVGEINNGIVEAIVTYEGDSLLIDFTNKTLLNCITDKDAIDVSSYNIHIGGNENNGKDESNRAIKVYRKRI